ncbi:sigma-54-dependent Fis family transcriptional regulator [bacterium]|nr:sigma-54-dependent Fis family transcriptional regulator [bacterium]
MSRGTVLVVDDEASISMNISKFMDTLGFTTFIVSNVKDAKNKLREESIDIVLTDVVMPGEDGLELLKYTKENYSGVKVILITGFTTVELTLKAIKYGVDAFLEKPVTFDQLQEELERIQDIKKKELTSPEFLYPKTSYIKKQNIVMSPNSSLLAITDFLEVIADKKASVFIFGESGTGKELIAQAIHSLSKRSKNHFIAINCGAIPETLLESELFGHTKGSFTGAIADKVGRIEMADKGTLFLDEIGELSLNMQVKLLRVLQERAVLPIGGKRNINVDFRLITATNVDIERAIIEKKFREDLFYRINVIPIVVPPLRERKEDIAALISYFIEQNNEYQDTQIEGVSKDAMEYLMNYSWPGNIRELQNLIERLSIIKDQGVIESKDLPEKILDIPKSIPTSLDIKLDYSDEQFDFKQMVESYQRELLFYALKKSGGSKKKAAEFLKLKRTTLIEMLKRLGMDSSDE